MSFQIERTFFSVAVTNPGAPTFDADDTIKAFFEALEDPAKASTTTETYAFAGWSKTADGEVIDETSEALMTTLLDEGATSITLYAKYTGTPISVPTIKVVYGDADLDGDFDIQDYNAISYYNLWDENMDGFRVGETVDIIVVGDVDGDGDFDIQDYNAVSYYNLWDENMDGFIVNDPVTLEVE